MFFIPPKVGGDLIYLGPSWLVLNLLLASRMEQCEIKTETLLIYEFTMIITLYDLRHL